MDLILGRVRAATLPLLLAGLERLGRSRLGGLADAAALLRMFRLTQGRWPALLRPRRFNDRLTRRIILSRDPMLRVFCDKLAMRRFAAERLGEDLAPPLLAVCARAEEVPWESLPPGFVLKPSHASGQVAIITDGGRADRAGLVAAARGWLAVDFHQVNREWGYRGAPRRLLVETLLPGGDEARPLDWRLHCFNGRVGAVQVTRIAADGGRSPSVFTPDGRLLPLRFNAGGGITAIPPGVDLARLIAVAARLSAGQPYLRVDLYWVAGRIWLGELTPYTDGGRVEFDHPRWDAWFGALWAAGAAGRAFPPPPQ